SSARRTARSSSSSGYFLGLDMTAEDLLFPRTASRDRGPRETRSGSLLLEREFPGVVCSRLRLRRGWSESKGRATFVARARGVAAGRVNRLHELTRNGDREACGGDILRVAARPERREHEVDHVLEALIG